MKKRSSRFEKRRLAAWMAAGALTLSACAEQAPPPAEKPELVAPAATVTTVERLPVSLNTVMVAMVNQAADPLWVAAWRNPESDADWRELERRAVQLELSGTLLSVPGTGPLDGQWVANPLWQNWATELRNVGASAVAAVKIRDIDEIATVGGQIVDICEGCHRDFKLALPTGGEFGELSPTSADFDEPEAEDY